MYLILIYLIFKIRCTAHIHTIFTQKTEKIIEKEKLVHLQNNNVNLVHNSIPYDPFNYNDGDFLDKKDTYLTHMKGRNIRQTY